MREAVAIRYDRSLPAPVVVAKGKGHAAGRIVALARDAGVAVVPMEDLTEKLMVLETGSFIPRECFAVVAELLLFVHKIREDKGKTSV